MSDPDLSNAYLRLRALIPGAYDTPNAPTPEQVWEVTEAALRRLLQERIAARQGERELCAREIEARACHIRDHGPTTQEGLLGALAGAQIGALLDAAASLRLTLPDPTLPDTPRHRPTEKPWPFDKGESGSTLAGTNPGDTPATTGDAP